MDMEWATQILEQRHAPGTDVFNPQLEAASYSSRGPEKFAEGLTAVCLPFPLAHCIREQS